MVYGDAVLAGLTTKHYIDNQFEPFKLTNPHDPVYNFIFVNYL